MKTLPQTIGMAYPSVVGKRADPADVIGKAIEQEKMGSPDGEHWTQNDITETLINISESSNRHGGLLVVIDEMGKFLENAAINSGDVNIFQDIAEIACRSNRHLIFIGVLHQTFEEYGKSLARDLRDEWIKIQGRFIDLPVNAAGEEQIDLLSGAIEAEHVDERIKSLAGNVYTLIASRRPNAPVSLPDTLGMLALSPLLPAYSRTYFKTQIWAKSKKPFWLPELRGKFLDFRILGTAAEDALYSPELLWDYLRTNFEAAILASPDGHKWATATEAIDRCEGAEEVAVEIALLKTIAVVDLFKDRSGLIPSEELLFHCMPSGTNQVDCQGCIIRTQSVLIIIFRKHLDAYAIFAGSDFDIEQALEDALEETRELELEKLQELANLQPILAKKHFHETGTLRWFELDISTVDELAIRAKNFEP